MIATAAAGMTIDSSFAVIQDIIIIGNKKTKDRAILRELEFTVGDTLWHSNLSETIERNQQYVFNTSLFQVVNLNIKNWDFEEHTLDLEITVSEDLYFYPIPIFSLADRNLNVWLNEFNASFRRVNYGMRFYHFNASGNNDRLRLITQFGYRQRYQLSYERPYINKSQTIGWNNSFRYDSTREINYRSLNNKQLFFDNNDLKQFQVFRFESNLIFRPLITRWHNFNFKFFNTRISEEVATDLNPNFFLNGRSQQRFFELEYAFTRDNRDLRVYAKNGSFFRGQLIKRGIGIFDDLDQLEIRLAYSKYFEINPKWSVELSQTNKISINRSQQPFFNIRALGFQNNVVRGFELFVVDGIDFIVVKSSLRRSILDANIDLGRMMPISNFRQLPLSIFLTFNFDVGYANDPFYAEGNPLSNETLYGGGIGMDVMFYNDFVFQLEYNLNSIGGGNFVVRSKLPF